MAIKVRIPDPIEKAYERSDEVTAAGKNVAEIIEDSRRTIPAQGEDMRG
jgi:hypothetical protein